MSVQRSVQQTAASRVVSEAADPSNSGAPFGPVGFDTEPPPERCKCGRPRHATDPTRCASGHVWSGAAGPALLTGEHSSTFWREHEYAQREIAGAIVRDAGHDPADAPTALKIAGDAIAMAVLLQTSSFSRVVEAGGPLSASGRPRRAFRVWLETTDRLATYLRLVGLRRVPRDAETLTPEEWLMRDATEGDAADSSDEVGDPARLRSRRQGSTLRARPED